MCLCLCLSLSLSVPPPLPAHALNKLYSTHLSIYGWYLRREGHLSVGPQRHPLLPHSNKHIPGCFLSFFIKCNSTTLVKQSPCPLLPFHLNEDFTPQNLVKMQIFQSQKRHLPVALASLTAIYHYICDTAYYPVLHR